MPADTISCELDILVEPCAGDAVRLHLLEDRRSVSWLQINHHIM
ncbi:hypothetical protein EI42_02214 [Thermosporothrix hazakensis]|jgi:hypothetical protein|uniref:Uncharacterized protein n=1 Tax=Thermosporothrix hazakensis TaxID=644383 RepID=A0A326U9B9_THEHA|nr:hypothetical protein [Thermosporothrix hazakensis]PZW31117.1 hypothetical protein EI42_02214 [Thermosporothrix hazakensis]